MKNNFFFVAATFLGAAFCVNAQVTQATNAVTSASSYVGTSNNYDVIFKRAGAGVGQLGTNKIQFGQGGNAGTNAVSVGTYAGRYSSGTGNTLVGYEAGQGTSTAPNTGNSNTFLGNAAGKYNAVGSANTYIGTSAGASNTSGYGNVFIGSSAGTDSQNGKMNVFIGMDTGLETDGTNNIIIGANAGVGLSAIQSNLIIDSDPNYYATPLIWGDFAADQLKLNGKVGVGGVTTFPTASGSVSLTNYDLFVKGGILAEEVRVSTTWADYVFKKDYRLMPLQELRDFIGAEGHLPNMPSEGEVRQDGISVGEMAKLQQEKIEELTLYLLQQDEKLKEQDKKLADLEALVLKMAKQAQP